MLFLIMLIDMQAVLNITSNVIWNSCHYYFKIECVSNKGVFLYLKNNIRGEISKSIPKGRGWLLTNRLTSDVDIVVDELCIVVILKAISMLTKIVAKKTYLFVFYWWYVLQDWCCFLIGGLVCVFSEIWQKRTFQKHCIKKVQKDDGIVRSYIYMFGELDCY